MKKLILLIIIVISLESCSMQSNCLRPDYKNYQDRQSSFYDIDTQK